MMKNSLFERYANFVTYRPVITLCLCLVALMGIAAGIGQLSFKSDLRIYFGPENPQVKALDHMEETYTKVDNVLFVLEAKNGIFTKETLQAIHTLTEKSWKIPFSSRVDSITNYKHSYAIDDDIMVDDLVLDVESLTSEDLSRIEGIARSAPLLVNRAISTDKEVTGVNVTINIPKGKELMSVPVVVKHARELAADIQTQYPDINLYLSGVVMMDNAFAEATEKDMQTLVPAMLTIALVLMGVFMRSVMASLAALLIITLVIVTAMGLAGYFGILLNPVSVNAPNIILTIAICDCVHLLSKYLALSRQGMAREEAMIESLSKTFKALFITTLTTCIGFLTLNASEAPPFRDLGNITALGVIMAFLFSITCLPALMMLIKVRPAGKIKTEFMEKMLSRLYERVIQKPSVMLLMSIVCVAGAGFGLTRIELNDEFVKYFDESIQFRQDTDFTADNLTGIYYIDYEIKGKTSSGVNDPEYLNTISKFTDWLRAQPEILHANSISDIYKRLNKNMHGDNPDYFSVPNDSEMAAQYLLIYEMSLPYGLDLRDRINANKDASRVTATLKNLSSQEVINFENRVQQWLGRHHEDIIYQDGVGLTIMFAHIGMRNIVSMLTGTAVALVVISLMLMAIFKSFRYGLISLVPNLLPAFVAFGIWGLFVGQVGLALSVMAAMTLGIVVDDTVHFFSHYIYAKKSLKKTTEHAIRYAFQYVGPALVTTTISLTVGFSVLGFSGFEINSGMGILTAMAISVALMLDLILLPALLLLLDRKPFALRAAVSKTIHESAA